MYSESFQTFCTSRTSLSSTIVSQTPLLHPICTIPPDNLIGNPLRIIACYHPALSYPLSIHTIASNCVGLLYSSSGNGCLTMLHDTYHIPSDTVFLFPCVREHVIEATTGNWIMTLIYFAGDIMQDYLTMFLQYNNDSMLYPIRNHSMIPKLVQNFTQIKKEHTLVTFLKETESLHSLFTNLLVELLQNKRESLPIPDYLLIMKHLLDTDYDKTYTLDSLAESLQVSKYRLCREFTSTYGISPLQYLNQKRLHEACRLLTDTSYHIYQIGTMVGICNTNHFINLFKRYFGVTPAVFRETHL